MLGYKRRHLNKGFTLLELSIYLIVIGIMTVALSGSFSQLQDAGNRDKTKIILKKSEIAITNFALGNNRLPCPDTNSDGREDCGAGSIGKIPFQTIELGGQALDANGMPITYSVYRNSSSNADLGTLIELKNAINGLNILDKLDFCEALSNGQNATKNMNLLSVSTNTLASATSCQNGSFINIAFILASGGNEDADHATPLNRFDQENSTNPALCFASPQKAISAQYDDLMTSISFSKLFEVACSYQ